MGEALTLPPLNLYTCLRCAHLLLPDSCLRTRPSSYQKTGLSGFPRTNEVTFTGLILTLSPRPAPGLLMLQLHWPLFSSTSTTSLFSSQGLGAHTCLKFLHASLAAHLPGSSSDSFPDLPSKGAAPAPSITSSLCLQPRRCLTCLCVTGLTVTPTRL